MLVKELKKLLEHAEDDAVVLIDYEPELDLIDVKRVYLTGFDEHNLIANLVTSRTIEIMIEEQGRSLSNEKVFAKYNINKQVKVKLTEFGVCIFNKHYERWGIKAPKLNIDDDGYFSFQMWDLMQIFGNEIYMGNEVPFETTVLIEMEETNNENK